MSYTAIRWTSDCSGESTDQVMGTLDFVIGHVADATGRHPKTVEEAFAIGACVHEGEDGDAGPVWTLEYGAGPGAELTPWGGHDPRG